MVEYIQYGDNGKVARDKINGMLEEVEKHIPSIGENGNRFLGNQDTGTPATGPVGPAGTYTEGEGIIIENDEISVDTDTISTKQYVNGKTAIVSATAPTNPTQGQMWYDTTTNILKTYDGTKWNVTSNFPGMSILSYGNSTWQDFINAYNAKAIVYCRASSNSNPATGSQTRMAFMAYVNNAENPTEVEFQYYRSVSTKSQTNQGDQVFVYKLNKTSGRTVQTRNAYTRIVAGTGLNGVWNNGVLTISLA